MQNIYSYIPETNHVFPVCNIAAVLVTIYCAFCVAAIIFVHVVTKDNTVDLL